MKRCVQLVVLVALLAAAVLVVPSTPVQAGDSHEKYFEWYSDATKTVVVGWRQDYCGGFSDSWGYTTPYYNVWWGSACVYS